MAVTVPRAYLSFLSSSSSFFLGSHDQLAGPMFSFFLLLLCITRVWAYEVIHDYSGSNFFNGWDFYGSWDNLTLGDVVWVDQTDAFNSHLAFVNDAGHAVLRVDNTTVVPFNEKRNSVRITSQASYDIGSLWIVDIVHLPYGCSVWPAFWTMGTLWPEDGEIDIIEAINLMDHNQMALHSTPGCTQASPVEQSGEPSQQPDCSQPAGCLVSETKPNSFGIGFNNAGGGVFAAQFDVSGIFIWFWSRPNIPPSITQATSTSAIDISQWGPPSASYPSTTCNIAQFFTSQQLVIDITLCGKWAGIPETYSPMCSQIGPTGQCYPDNVVGPGDRYDDAYFEINYLRAYTTNPSIPAPTVGAIALSSFSSSATSPIPNPTAGIMTTLATSSSPAITGAPSDSNAAMRARVPETLLVICWVVVSGLFV
ncbi:hypothetical protein BDN72DRAFT_842854 [Pluteus cervinus]|uniref:Uncharacterized protein n=1 Tax=Pluteus cervinus TaxID=181527 RepID=A0ACD3API7_9AGAR|nr:hypothetical protein BDN72DRAFT_842854 [Pluteus cervinus]